MTNMGYLIRKKHEGRGQQHYFTSNDPHHGIYTFSYWQIFWHSIWHIFWHSIWHSIWHIFWHSIWHIFWHSIWHIFWHSVWHIFWHSIWPLRSGSAHCDLEVAVEVRQCPLRSGSRGWGPAVPTGIWSSRWRSGSAHWDLALAVEVRLCPLGSGLRGGGGRGGGGCGGGGEQLWQNLTTLTWQVGQKIFAFFLLHVWVIKSWFLSSLSCIDSICYLINIWRTLPYNMMVRQTL